MRSTDGIHSQHTRASVSTHMCVGSVCRIARYCEGRHFEKFNSRVKYLLIKGGVAHGKLYQSGCKTFNCNVVSERPGSNRRLLTKRPDRTEFWSKVDTMSGDKAKERKGSELRRLTKPVIPTTGIFFSDSPKIPGTPYIIRQCNKKKLLIIK